eukprot:5476168-Ditylum_brightwellii.AAC.1
MTSKIPCDNIYLSAYCLHNVFNHFQITLYSIGRRKTKLKEQLVQLVNNLLRDLGIDLDVAHDINILGDTFLQEVMP